MKKIISMILMLVFSIVAMSIAYSAPDDMVAQNITANYPTTNTYVSTTGNNALTRLNATVRWTPEVSNISTVVWHFISGTTNISFTNETVNGTRTTTGKGDFTFTISANNLTANTQYTVKIEIKNSTVTDASNGAVNSTSATFTLDSTNPTVTLDKPTNYYKVNIKGGGDVVFKYTPTDTNLGNATLYVDGQKLKSSTSGTTSSNLTSGSINEFTKYYNSNNNSAYWNVEITDLAGNKKNSTTWYYSVYTTGAASAAQVYITDSGERIPISQKPTQSVSPITNLPLKETITNFVVKWIWLIVIIVAVGGFILFKTRKKKK